MTELRFPSRYESLRRLGKGGGGEVWAVRDRHTDERLALKVLAPEATDAEMEALVREAVTLSGLEGLGVPRVHRFGRLPGSGRPFMVRELVEGASLQEMFEAHADARVCLEALAGAAEQVTVLHRAGLLHGDIKPANIIVGDGARAHLVDLGLAAPWQEKGTTPQGLTPKYAAPELLSGHPLTVRAEVYALGVTLSELVAGHARELTEKVRSELGKIADRATADEPTARYPSADEFASAVRRGANLSHRSAHAGSAGGTWPIVGIDASAARLQSLALELESGKSLVVSGPEGSGRSVLLRRLAWGLGVSGCPIAYLDAALVQNVGAIEGELAEYDDLDRVLLLVDDADRLPDAARDMIERARRAGARLVLVDPAHLDEPAPVFEVPGLAEHIAVELLRRAVPSLTDRMLRQVVQGAGGRPGELRRFVKSVAETPVVSEADIAHALRDLEARPDTSTVRDPLSHASRLLDRGRYTEAARVLDGDVEGDPLKLAIARARLAVGLGDAEKAVTGLGEVQALAERAEPQRRAQWAVYFGRAHVGVGKYAEAVPILESVTEGGVEGAEAQAYLGLAHAYLGDSARAVEVLTSAIAAARAVGTDRVEGLALICLGIVHQRADRTEAARTAYESAIAAAERVGDAGTLATAQLNLAGLLRIHGDLATAISLFEAAADTGRRAGRLYTVRNALLNLVNLDLYLGRLSRARASIEALSAEEDALSPSARAQLAGHQAELHACMGRASQAVEAYERRAALYLELGLKVDAAESMLEGILVAARQLAVDTAELADQVDRAEELLEGSSAHRPLLCLARASVARASGDDVTAREHLGRALTAAKESSQREFIWRTLEVRAEIEEAAGQRVGARRDREEALSVLEEIAARLPRDLREVFWNDARRRALRVAVERTLGSAATEHVEPRAVKTGPGTSHISSMSSTPLERRLSRILEVNAELLGELDLDRLATRVTDHAVDMLHAERGHVILRDPDGSLSVRTSRARGGRSAAEEFSRSVAEQVVEEGEPVVSLNARGDDRMQSFASVHRLMVESVACVPIPSRSSGTIGALYVETRLRPGEDFEKELPTLRAFADQVGIAIETANLIRENKERAEALAISNERLERAQAELEELLGDRTAELARTRKKLRDARQTLYGHFGYQGLVGTSQAMRRVYALIERLKDTDVPVLITGESGTGKEVVARAIHRSSPRQKRPFVGVNCGAIPENLLESELFGHVRGAFTGADRERKGLLREAEGGSVLLDEIGEMPHKMQAGLLRVLQERKVRPVGGADEVPVDTRMIFATHRDLEAMVKSGSFREDLYYRIHVVEVEMPPLRERPEDIPLLVDHFLGIFAARYKREKKTVSREALRRLSAFDFPGNVRQLEHVLLNAWVLSDGDILEVEDFDLPDGRVAPEAPRTRGGPGTGDAERVAGGETPRSASVSSSRRQTLSKHRRDEKARILEALEACNWNRVRAAELSGIPRRTFYRRLRQYGIQ